MPSREQSLSVTETPRSIELGDRVIPYVLRRARRRTIGLTIDHRGLRVGAPPRASIYEIESLILRHGTWVTDKLDEWRARRDAETVRLVDGVCLPFLSTTVEIRLALGANRALWSTQTPQRLTLLLRSPEDAPCVLERALRERAIDLFSERLACFAERMGLRPPALSLSSARTRWGSCSLRSGIRLNWRLIHFPPHIIDYVVVHELAHLREMNHSARFWAVVGQHYPDYRHARGELKRLAASCPRW